MLNLSTMGTSNDDSWINALEDEGYTVLQSIDYGSFSDVFTVKQHSTDKVLALKKIVSSRPIEEEDIFLSEIKCLFELRHRHVIQLHDVVITTHTGCIVMEFAPLGNLQQYVNDNAKLSHSYSFNTFRQLLSGLTFCHKNHIAHRDLNPSNILLISPTLVKLADFGLGFVCKDSDGSENLCSEYLGQAAYLAPEILMHSPFKPKPADVWGLGCILFFMCFRDKPFSGSEQTILSMQKGTGLIFPLDKVTTPSLFTSTLYDMCRVDVNRRHTIDCVEQHWLHSNMENI